MYKIDLKEKFIGYIDILGYKALTKAAEAGVGFSFEEMDELLNMLGSEETRLEYQRRTDAGLCPGAPCISPDVDFQLTQAWDSVVVSTEVSPRGVINLVWHCFGACIKLLTKGVMCRGYVKRGMIYHDSAKVFGSGHVEAVEKERGVSFFKQSADERGTPFIEVDQEVVDYVQQQSDQCVKTMFARAVLSHDGLYAVFPLKRLSHSFIIGDYGGKKFDPAEEKKHNNVVRQKIKGLKVKLMSFVDNSDPSALRKADYYIRALDKQLEACDRTDGFLDMLQKPYPRPIPPERCLDCSGSCVVISVRYSGYPSHQAP